MGPPSVSKANVKYPIFAATFAQNNSAILVVGGGGGAGRSGVPNSICAFDTSSRAPTLEPYTHADLSRDEDSVTSIAAVSTQQGCILYAGVNSTEAERLRGENAHFRAFELTYPAKKAESAEKTPGQLQFLSKAQLLAPATKTGRSEGYQRLVRLSPPAPGGKSGGKRIGVVASSLQGDENELVIFPAVSTKPSLSDVIQRIPLKGNEANDVDIFETQEGGFQVAYCLDAAVYVQRFSYDFEKRRTSKKLEEPHRVYHVPALDAAQKMRPKLRALRWLSPHHILLLVNKPNRSGVELQVLRLYSEDGMGSIVLRKTLGKGAKQAVDMDVVRLNADAHGKYQVAIAVATQDVSLHIFTTDHHKTSFSKLVQYNVYQNVHDVQMTKVVWSPFSVPENAEGPRKARLLRLASTSLSGSISVDTFELQPTGPASRYILQSARTRSMYNVALYAICAFIALMLALMVQSLVDPHGNLTKGLVPSYLQNIAGGAKAPGVIMEDMRRAQAGLGQEDVPVAKTTTQRIRDLLHLHGKHNDADAQKKALVIILDPESETSLSTELHEGGEEDLVKKYTEAKRWEELSHEQRKVWKEKLAAAGMWAVEEGETILKSIFFSEAGGLVGHVVHGVLNG